MARKVRRFFLAAIIGTVSVLGVGVAAFFYIGRTSGSGLEQWIARQVVSVVDTLVQPKVTYATIDYTAPYTVDMTDLRLTFEGQPLVIVDDLRIELAERPRVGQPIRIKQVRLIDPELRFTRSPEGFEGWSEFLEPDLANRFDDGPPRKLSETLVLELVEIKNGRVRYIEPERPDHEMVIPGITTTIKTQPTAGEPGWYQCNATLQRPPFFQTTLDSQVNLDTGVTKIALLDYALKLTPAEYSSVPPALQQILTQHQVRGDLQGRVTGTFDLAKPATSTGSFSAKLLDARLMLDKFDWRVENAVVNADLADKNLAANFRSTLLGGNVKADATVELTGLMPTAVKWNMTDIRLGQMMREEHQKQGVLRGRTSGSGTVQAAALAPDKTLAGSGQVQIREGRLMTLPVLGKIQDTVMAIPGQKMLEDRDSADVEFTLMPERVVLDSAEVASPLMRVRGDGSIYFDQRLDLLVTTRLLGKVGGLFGDVSEAIGKIGDKLATYHVGGTIDKPKVSVKPLGL